MMDTREFTDQDWMAYSGAESWSNADPLIARGRLVDGREYDLVFDATGANLLVADEHDDSGIWILNLPFPTQLAALVFAIGMGNPIRISEFEDLGFYPADD